MKVEHHGPSLPAQRSEETSRAAEAQTSSAYPSGVASTADTVSLSSHVEFVRSAVERATAQPDVRPDVVQRMRELMDRGEIGQDAERLAEAMIDRWLAES